MKETVYKCDVCKNPKERNDLLVYYVDEEGDLDIFTEKDIELINSDSYICYHCLYAIYKFEKERQENSKERATGGG